MINLQSFFFVETNNKWSQVYNFRFKKLAEKKINVHFSQMAANWDRTNSLTTYIMYQLSACFKELAK